MIIVDNLKGNAEKVFLSNYECVKTEMDFIDLCDHMRKYYDWSNEDLYMVMLNNDLIDR